MDYLGLAEEAVRRGAIQQARELAQLLELVNPGDVAVEIGCDAGGVLWALQELGARVIGVDLPGGAYSSGADLDGRGADIVLGDSHNPATRAALVDKLAGLPIDLLFIDGDHTYKGVRADYESYAPLVRSGGWVAFHDICHHHLFPDVRVDRLWWEIKAKHPGKTTEFIYYVRPWGHGMGIGVMQHG